MAYEGKVLGTQFIQCTRQPRLNSRDEQQSAAVYKSSAYLPFKMVLWGPAIAGIPDIAMRDELMTLRST